MNSHKLALLVTFLSLACGVGVAVAFAQGSPASPSQTTTACEEQSGQQGIDELGTANDIEAAAEEVEQEADTPQADDQAGDQQGPNDQADEQDESNECGDQGGDTGDNGGD